MQPKDYPNIIFDFGGVILNIDYNRTINAFRSMGVERFDEKYTQFNQSPIFDQLERGEIAPVDFREGLREMLGKACTDQELDNAWNAMLLDLPAERLQLLKQLSTQRRIILLSNTNVIHVACFETEMKRLHGIDNLNGYFEKVFYSCSVGMRKPESRIFEFVLDEMGFNPSETLFIDDSPQHIEGARSAGINAYHLRADKGETIMDLF